MAGTTDDPIGGAEKITPAILERRNKVASLMLLGHTIDSTATELKVGTATIKRDRAWLREQGAVWSDDQAMGGFMFDCKTQLQRIEQSITNLEKMRDQKTEDGDELPFWHKLHLEKTIAELAAKKMEINDMVPMYHKMTKYMKKHGVSQPSTYTN